ncbi:CHRD domain-containing protein [Arthrobacter sp. CJ23]|uniref:CHRD domain-containing protein n=1 Tax=Arthrobacter sp. CJ23 TaxID=2972479 RepID=UPI00215CA279|nr:CHRD domain-containing protein [Arthrobacter sp. CJ23]UVJ40626.1 CHRD domain-containing protein [Arthrobacter sp. CJ23]
MQRMDRTRVRKIAAAGAIAALVSVGAGAGAAGANPGGVPAIPLNTEQEVTGSNTGANGFFSYTIDGDQLCYTMSARNLSLPATAAHIHLAPRNVAGPVLVPLTVGSGSSWTVSACAAADEAVLQAIADSPRSYYVNVHTPTFPGGEIRGQLK